MTAPLLEARDLAKSYGGRPAVAGVTLALAPGEIFGLLGPNGAGKTTTVSMLCGLLPPDAGTVLVGGRAISGDADPAKRQIGLVPQEIALYDELSALANLRFFGALYGLGGAALESAIGAALELVGLADRARDLVKTMSGGMKRRLNLAGALLHDPAVLLLDEPTVGVDPQSRNAIFDNLEELRRRGKALLYTTHYMEEAERLCDRIAIVDSGQVIAEGTLRELLKMLPASNRLRVEVEGVTELPLAELKALAGVAEEAEPSFEDGRLTVALSDLPAGTAAVLGWLTTHGATAGHLASERGNLEAVFLHMTGRRLRDA
ncbi:MAG TPA: ABC transporter ATP-binding protein [Thermoanaerobaculia bacterium]|jgi:ABC-2 type transport system ATP-binding protein|nr:ABC transporter ATP-binding protein [Thermoanaerobaculia bacterium]